MAIEAFAALVIIIQVPELYREVGGGGDNEFAIDIVIDAVDGVYLGG